MRVYHSTSTGLNLLSQKFVEIHCIFCECKDILLMGFRMGFSPCIPMASQTAQLSMPGAKKRMSFNERSGSFGYQSESIFTARIFSSIMPDFQGLLPVQTARLVCFGQFIQYRHAYAIGFHFAGNEFLLCFQCFGIAVRFKYLLNGVELFQTCSSMMLVRK